MSKDERYRNRRHEPDHPTKFDGARDRTWEAWTDPEQVEKWWGPDGFTITTEEIDVQPGGTWRFIMHGPDGVDYENELVYDELVEPERLVYTQAPPEEQDLEGSQVTVTFEEGNADETDLTMTMRFESAAERERQEEFGAVEGAKQTLDRLADHLTNSGVA